MAEDKSDQLITQASFVHALTQGIQIPAISNGDMCTFCDRLIAWINSTDNIYWAGWDRDNINRIIVDLRSSELMQLHISPGLLEFRRVEDNIEHDMAEEFGNGVVGVMLFCMIENGEIEEIDLANIAKEEPAQTAPPLDSPTGEEPDFEWI